MFFWYFILVLLRIRKHLALKAPLLSDIFVNFKGKMKVLIFVTAIALVAAQTEVSNLSKFNSHIWPGWLNTRLLILKSRVRVHPSPLAFSIVYLSVSLPACLSVCLSVCLSIFLSISPSLRMCNEVLSIQ